MYSFSFGLEVKSITSYRRYNLNFGYFVRDKEAAESPSDASDADSGHASGYDSAEDELYLHPHPPRVTGN